MKKDVTVDGLQKTTYLKDDMDGKIAIKEQVDVTSHLKHNKILTNLNDGYSKSRDLKRVLVFQLLLYLFGRMSIMVQIIGLDFQKMFKKKY